MIKILVSSEMRDIDRRAIEEVGIPGPLLMENAGREVVQAMGRRVPDLERKPVVVVAGKGNNGGDGFVVARHLANLGGRPSVLLLASQADVRGDAALNMKIALKLGLPIVEVTTEAAWRKARTGLFHAGVIVDALLGTGLTEPLSGLYAQVVEDINKARGFTVAVDMPSGLSSDTFMLLGPCVEADLTVCLAAPKIAHIFPPSADRVGELVVAGISIPPFLFDDPRLKLSLLEAADVRPHFRPRPKDSHKGTYGHLLIVAGSVGKAGAAVLAGRAALRMGAGLVTMAVPAACLPAVARPAPELMVEPLAGTPDGTVAAAAAKRVLELLKGKDALLLGPGISTHPETAAFVGDLLPRVKVPAVLDADALNIVAARRALLDDLGARSVLTPHPGEFARLLGLRNQDVVENKLTLVPEFAVKHRLHLVLKGYRTLVAAPDGRVFVNPTGNPGLATGGAGDVLGGLIASQVMQTKDVLTGTMSAVYAHGLSGDLAAAKLGERALIAGDLIRFLPAALKSLEA
ncbi:MAG: NAD(P)H-hydrate dehydratase [Candidatus Aminicenantes bacterium]|nr:NAD(P)H-hydrate dehydratase [Candidatus Aminicenantes bacterium]